jgi:hypothetical protein
VAHLSELFVPPFQCPAFLKRPAWIADKLVELQKWVADGEKVGPRKEETTDPFCRSNYH